MSTPSTFEVIPVAALVDRVRELHKARCRLVQIGATRLPERVELNYSFDDNGRLLNLRLELPSENPRVPSISAVYWCAFIYENEIHDLFKVDVDGMAIDFQGKFYQTSVKFPFGSLRPPVVKPATPVAAPTAAPAAAGLGATSAAASAAPPSLAAAPAATAPVAVSGLAS
jgi:ech hydrogenase subunit D